MSAEGDIFAGLLALYAADNSAGGLAFSSQSNPAFLRGGFWRIDDAGLRTVNNVWPRVEVDIRLLNADTCQTGGYEAAISMIAVADRNVGSDSTFTVIDAVLDRLRTVFHLVKIADTASWLISAASYNDIVKQPPTTKELRRGITFDAGINKNSGTA